jgi:16S rRNA processing protein RimM
VSDAASVAASVANAAGIVILGKIVGPYGVRGAVKVHPFADDPQGWARLSHWWLGREDDAPAQWRQARVLRCKLHGETLIAELDCVPDRATAEALHGVFVGAPREALPATASDEYYWGDLLGLAVVNTRGDALGRVLGLIETPGNDVLRVGDGEGPERLLPFVATVVLEVDLGERRIRVDWEADW